MHHGQQQYYFRSTTAEAARTAPEPRTHPPKDPRFTAVAQQGRTAGVRELQALLCWRATICNPSTAAPTCSPHAIRYPNPYPNLNPILLHLNRSRVPKGIRSGRDQGRGVDQIKSRCGLLSPPVQHKNTILGCGLHLGAEVHRS